MEIEELKKLNVDEFHKNYIQKFKNKPFPLFSIIEFNLHGSCSRRCAFCPRVDEKIWPNLDEELNMELFDKILFELEELDKNGRKTKSIRR